MQVPVLETPDGCICEATAIARFIGRLRGDSNMFGSSFFEAALVDQWIAFAKNELDLPVGMWVYPILGFIESNAANTAQARPCRAIGSRQTAARAAARLSRAAAPSLTPATFHLWRRRRTMSRARCPF